MNYTIRPREVNITAEILYLQTMGFLFMSADLVAQSLIKSTLLWVYDLDKDEYVTDEKKAETYVSAQIAILGQDEFIDRVDKKVKAYVKRRDK